MHFFGSGRRFVNSLRRYNRSQRQLEIRKREQAKREKERRIRLAVSQAKVFPYMPEKPGNQPK